MKTIIFLCNAAFLVFSVSATAKEAQPKKPVIAIQSIQDRSANSGGDSCGFYGIWSTPGSAVAELLFDELSRKSEITLVERENIGTIYEDELKQENLDPSTVVEKKKFIAANLVIAGSITEFEWCQSGQSQGIDVGGLLGIGELSVKHKSSVAHVAIKLRLVDVQTGKILKAFTGEGKIDDSGLAVGADAFGIRLDKAAFQRSPLGKATKLAVAEAANQISDEIKKLN